MFKKIVRRSSPQKRLSSFTLIELLVVMAVIAILAALVLGAGTGALNKALRSRASAEIQAVSAALESYKADNGVYILDSNLATTNAYGANDGSQAGGLYQLSSENLYANLSGQAYFNTTPTAGVKSYFAFKANQVGNPGGPNSYVKDPWNYSYGYFTGSVSGTTTNAPYTGYGFFDLWSTGGATVAQETAKPSLANGWISNWNQ